MLLFAIQAGWGASSRGGNYTLVKSHWGGSGAVRPGSGSAALSGSAGEPVAGNHLGNASHDLISGYFSGHLGAGPGLHVLRTQVGNTSFYQDGVQVGVPLQATVQVVFSDQLNPSTLAAGIQIVVALDHMGRQRNEPVPVRYEYDPAGAIVLLSAAPGWLGNTLYEIHITPGLQSIDGFTPSNAAPIRFVTAMDPRQENVVQSPVAGGAAGAPPRGPVGASDRIELNFPAGALPDYSVALVSRDPLHAPLRVSPSIILEANQKAAARNNRYGVPIAIQEVTIYTLQGQRLESLSRPVLFSMAYNDIAGQAGGIIRTQSLSIWALDEEHRLWVKLPDSVVHADARVVSAPVARFSVFALMGAPSGNASDVMVFPVPWRPNGPSAGDGPGNTGTHAGGMTFSNLPSECLIRIYTLSGDLVRELSHSDLSGALGQEHWDGRTAHGKNAASGVYLWRVESMTDGKNGKLMIIR
ncbi:MAG: hypothetical protein A2992_02350 [Elusimicrobia bacterium RIFCSPLOWO2_01_FULL_59_12]|nr:MAG: hypothetical protein A2992_02350 [Elusimicrobia bacterium RIFCSPLOWO2_01_FULL_59_12]